MNCELRQARTPGDMAALRSIRFSVFVDEQAVPQDIEMDEHDADALHVLCLVDGKPVGTGRLVQMQDGLKLGRVAVLREYRGRGLGTEIVSWLLAKAGDSEVYANVQTGAREFYEKLGFAAAGGLFLEAGIEHVRMVWRKK